LPRSCTRTRRVRYLRELGMRPSDAMYQRGTTLARYEVGFTINVMISRWLQGLVQCGI
jgi:hypothetical protein